MGATVFLINVIDHDLTAWKFRIIVVVSPSLDVIETDFTHGQFRADALHVRGTENLSTQQIFNYFQAYAPSSLEWISDNSCKLMLISTSDISSTDYFRDFRSVYVAVRLPVSSH